MGFRSFHDWSVNFVDLDVISSPDAGTVLDATETRNLLLDELLEVT